MLIYHMVTLIHEMEKRKFLFDLFRTNLLKKKKKTIQNYKIAQQELSTTYGHMDMSDMLGQRHGAPRIAALHLEYKMISPNKTYWCRPRDFNIQTK